MHLSFLPKAICFQTQEIWVFYLLGNLKINHINDDLLCMFLLLFSSVCLMGLKRVSGNVCRTISLPGFLSTPAALGLKEKLISFLLATQTYTVADTRISTIKHSYNGHGSIHMHMQHPLACNMFPVPEVYECDSPQMWRCCGVYVESD